jgi:hypothetical protein
MDGGFQLCQQVAPAAVTIGIADRVGGSSQRPRGIGILFAAFDIARIVVCPDMGKAACLVILPGQLVGRVVGVAVNRGRLLAIGSLGTELSPVFWF